MMTTHQLWEFIFEPEGLVEISENESRHNPLCGISQVDFNVTYARYMMQGLRCLNAGVHDVGKEIHHVRISLNKQPTCESQHFNL